MKIKKFDNIWTIGFILFGALLILFYVGKLLFPHFIVGVAEVPRIVVFGNFIDSNKWFYHIFEFLWGTAIFSIYTCACCRMRKPKPKDLGVVALFVLAMRLLYEFKPEYYFGTSISFLVLCPFVVCFINRNLSKDTFVSLVFCFFVDNFSQILSMKIRDLTIMAQNINTATLIILTIDVIIWRMLLYCYFNFKNIKKEN